MARLEGCLRQQADLGGAVDPAQAGKGLELSGSPTGKPYASAQAGRGELKPEFFMFLARARGSLAACFFSASKYDLCEISRDLQRVASFRLRYACHLFGLNARRSPSLSANF